LATDAVTEIQSGLALAATALSTTQWTNTLAICEGGADPLLEIDRGSSGTVLIPFRREFIGDIDLQSRHLVLLAPWILE
jgi:hypothetical protein